MKKRKQQNRWLRLVYSLVRGLVIVLVVNVIGYYLKTEHPVLFLVIGFVVALTAIFFYGWVYRVFIRIPSEDVEIPTEDNWQPSDMAFSSGRSKPPSSDQENGGGR